ncbi:MAG TPA: hypothetical protein DEH27_05040 [Deltaproteobacteria bacterium]|nr:hypothetical protein [Deltaproteobacteria bacterium]
MTLARNEKGVVIVFVLLLALVGLITIAGLLHMLARSGYVSGQQKRYNTALEAGRGGVEATLEVVADRGQDKMGLTNLVLGADLDTKLMSPTESWGMGVDSSSAINPAVNNSYDIRFDLGNYRIYTKIVDTVDGNSGADTGLLKAGVVNAGSGEVTVMNIPYLYTIEELTETPGNASERAKLSVLYQY